MINTHRLQAAISDVSSPQFRTTVYGILFGACGGLMMLSAVGTMMIEDKWGTRATFYAFVATKIVHLLYLIIFIPESLKEKNRKSMDEDKDLFDKNKDYAMQQSIELNKIGIDISNGNIQYDQMDGKRKCGKCKKCCDSKHNPLRPLCYLRSNYVIFWVGILTLLTAFPGISL